MKNLLLSFLLITVTSIQASALPPSKNVLIIRLNNDAPLTVSINGRDYNKIGKSITIGDLPSGHHGIRVYGYHAYRDEQAGNAKLLYKGSVRVRKHTITTCIVNPRSATMRVSYTDTDDVYADEEKPSKNYDNNRGSKNITEQDLADLKRMTAAKITDSDRIKLLQSAVTTKGYTSEDVRAMMRCLNFESSKVEFAKWAYAKVLDPTNYWRLDSEFSYESSKNELAEFIKPK